MLANGYDFVASDFYIGVKQNYSYPSQVTRHLAMMVFFSRASSAIKKTSFGLFRTSLLCAGGACCPGHTQRALAANVQRREGQGWGPSYCEKSLEMAQGWGPT